MDGGIRVRFFRRSDSEQVRGLFVLAMSTGPGSPRHVALKDSSLKPVFLMVYPLALAGLFMALISNSRTLVTLGLLLFSTVVTLGFGYRYLLSRSFTDIIAQWLKEDLADIASYYHMVPVEDGSEGLVPSSESGFWVAECAFPGSSSGTEIVGCIALDCRAKSGLIDAEVRRMVVSPYHRRKGIASHLMRTVLAHAKDRDLSALHLTTTEHQGPAMSTYRSLGWVEVGRTLVREFCGIIHLELVHFRFNLRPKEATVSMSSDPC